MGIKPTSSDDSPDIFQMAAAIPMQKPIVIRNV